jgi:NDP-sugar pyrophosphorylase family protein
VARTQILMAMGGLGSRFTEQGYDTPKPLIPVDGKAMFLKALESFQPLSDTDFIFVLRKDQVDKYKLDKQIHSILPSAKIAMVEHNTRGAVETCLIASNLILDEVPLIIADCDIYFESEEYFEKIKHSGADGILLTFISDQPRYSYVQLDENDKVVRTAEKVVISNHAILGGYYFKSGKLFKTFATEFVQHPLPKGLKEYFVSHLFNMLIEASKTIEIATTDKMHIFGTPEELNAYINRYEVGQR